MGDKALLPAREQESSIFSRDFKAAAFVGHAVKSVKFSGTNGVSQFETAKAKRFHNRFAAVGQRQNVNVFA